MMMNCSELNLLETNGINSWLAAGPLREEVTLLLEARRTPGRFLVQFSGQAMNATESDSFNGQAMSATESDSRFRILADSAPVLLWMSGPDKLCTFLNKTWLDFTGRSFEQEKGYGWSEGVHPEDLEGFLRVYFTSFDARVPFVMQSRLKRHDGEYRWLSAEGVPRYEKDGTFAGYIGSCVDITEQKLLEEA